MTLRTRPAYLRTLAGKASNYISLFTIKPGQRVIICVRVSTVLQCDHLPQQEARLREAVEAQGGVVAAVYSRVGVRRTGGDGQGPDGQYMSWLYAPIAHAREENAILLFESTDRIVRHPGYGKDWLNAIVRRPELEHLAFDSKGVRLTTLIDPDAEASPVRSHQTKRGQSKSVAAKGGRRRVLRPGGSKRARVRLRPDVLKMRRDGKSLREIANATGKGKSTIQRWIAGSATGESASS